MGIIDQKRAAQGTWSGQCCVVPTYAEGHTSLGARGGHIYNSIQITKILSSLLFTRKHCYFSRCPSSFLWDISPSRMTRSMIFHIPPFCSSCLTTSPIPRMRNQLSQALLCPGFCLLFPNYRSLCPRAELGVHGEMGSILPSCIHSNSIEMPIMNPIRF